MGQHGTREENRHAVKMRTVELKSSRKSESEATLWAFPSVPGKALNA